MEVDSSSRPLHFLCTQCSIPRGIARLVPDQAYQVCVYCADGTTGHDSSTELIFCFSQFHEATQDSFGGMFDTKKSMEREEHHCCNCISQPSIEWEITKMIGLYVRMRDLYRRLRQRVKLIRGDNQYEIDPYFVEAFQDKFDLSNNTGGDTDLDFLYDLTGAINEWLEEIQGSANGRLSHPASYQLGRVSMDLGRYDASHTIDGNMLSSEVIQRIRSFEKAWMERYSRGEDPYTVPVPTLSKELLVHIIRRCPMIEKDIWVSVRKSGDQSSQSRSLQRHSVHSPDWLAKHLGHRFMTKKLVLGHRAETIIHLKIST